jgi:phage terminase large subunit-like protein
MFVEKNAELCIRFFERMLTHTKGVYARKPFHLLDWQREIVWNVFGNVKSNGLRQFTTVYCEVPKKNGKTELAAGIALFGLLMDDEPGCEVYIAAASRDQASIGFRVAAQMVRNNPRLNALCNIYPSVKTITLKSDTNSFLKAISSDANTQDGINPHMAIFDELHRQKNTDLWDVLKYGMATRTQPLMFAITTAGIIGESPICEQQHDYARSVEKGIFRDPSYYSAVYGLEEKEDWTLEGEPARYNRDGDLIKPATGWFKANPSLGHHLQLDKIREEYRQAANNPSQQNSFRRLRLNQWVGQEERYLPLEDWLACGDPFNPSEFIGKPCFAGMDLSATEDITAFVMLFEREDLIYWIPHFWIPAHELQKRARKDRVPYDIWVAQGLIHTTPGNQIDQGLLRKHISELADIYDIREVGYDRWMATQIVTDLKNDGLEMTPIGQGIASMSAPTKELLRLVQTKKIRHNGNDVLTWMADCFSVIRDTQDNVKPSKPKRNRDRKRIDGIQAGINGLARLIVNRKPLVKPKVLFV